MSAKQSIIRRLSAFLLAIALCFTTLEAVEVKAATLEDKNAIDLAEFGLQAYRDEWYYVYGCFGQMGESGHRLSDCSGLVYAYLTWDEENDGPSVKGSIPRGATAQYFSCSERGYIDSMPRTHGLLVFYYNGWDCSHVGISVGGGYAVDNSYYGTNMIHGRIADNSSWTAWGKLDCIEYPTDGWYEFDGKPFFYMDGEYVIDAKVTIDGTEYSFDSKGSPSPAPENYENGSGEVSEFTYCAPGRSYMTAVTADIEIKREAHHESGAVCKVADGTKLTVKDSSDENWYKVSLPGEVIGYVETSTLRNTASEVGIATVDVTVRSEPSEYAPAAAGLYTGDHAVITNTDVPGWLGVKLMDGTTGYVYAQYMDVSIPAVNTSIGNIRKYSDPESEIIKTIASGTDMTVLHITEEWAKVRLENGTTGHLPASIIDMK